MLVLLACSSPSKGPPSWEAPNPGDRIEYRVTLEEEDAAGGWSKLKLQTTELAASARVVAVDEDTAWIELAVTRVNGEFLDVVPVARPLLLPMELGDYTQPSVEPTQTQTLAGRALPIEVQRRDLRPDGDLLTERWTTPLAESLYLCDGVVRTLVETPRRDGVVSRRVIELMDIRWGGGALLDESLPRFFDPGAWSLWTRKSQGRETLIHQRYAGVAGELRRHREIRAATDHSNEDCLEHEGLEWCMTGEQTTTSMRLHQLLDDLVGLALGGDWAPEGLADSVPTKQGYLPVKVGLTEGVMSVDGRPLEFTAMESLSTDPLSLDGLPWLERFGPLRQTRSFPHPWQEKGSDEQLLDWGAD